MGKIFDKFDLPFFDRLLSVTCIGRFYGNFQIQGSSISTIRNIIVEFSENGPFRSFRNFVSKTILYLVWSDVKYIMDKFYLIIRKVISLSSLFLCSMVLIYGTVLPHRLCDVLRASTYAYPCEWEIQSDVQSMFSINFNFNGNSISIYDLYINSV